MIIQRGAAPTPTTLPKKVAVSKEVHVQYSDGSFEKIGFPEYLIEQSKILTEVIAERDAALDAQTKTTSLTFNGGRIAVIRDLARALGFAYPSYVQEDSLDELLEKVEKLVLQSKATKKTVGATQVRQLADKLDKAAETFNDAVDDISAIYSVLDDLCVEVDT